MAAVHVQTSTFDHTYVPALIVKPMHVLQHIYKLCLHNIVLM